MTTTLPTDRATATATPPAAPTPPAHGSPDTGATTSGDDTQPRISGDVARRLLRSSRWQQ